MIAVDRTENRRVYIYMSQTALNEIVARINRRDLTFSRCALFRASKSSGDSMLASIQYRMKRTMVVPHKNADNSYSTYE